MKGRLTIVALLRDNILIIYFLFCIFVWNFDDYLPVIYEKKIKLFISNFLSSDPISAALLWTDRGYQ
jgi:hypothetical protein